MNICLSSKDGVTARKKHRCAFCFEAIAIGEKYDKRTGVGDDGIWTMAMHPECHTYEDEALTADDYEDMSDPVFTREEAKAFVASRATTPAESSAGR